MSNLRKYEGSELELFAKANNWKKYFSSSLHPYIFGDVAEIGAGMGMNSTWLRNERVSSWASVEPDSYLCSIMAEHYGEIKFQSKILNNFSNELVEQSYDCLLYIDVLEHIEGDSNEVNNAWEKLKPGGFLVILSPAFEYFYSEFDQAIGHYRRYNKKTLRACVDSNKFLEKKVSYLDSIGVLASLTNKWFLKQSIPTEDQVNMWDSRIVPVSKVFDKVLSPFFGKSIIGVWQKRSN